MNNLFDNKFEEYLTKVKNNNDDFVWILYEKPCGYSFIQPVLKNAPVNSLYNNLDYLWLDTINHIWTANNQYLLRNNTMKIRDWVISNNMLPISSFEQPIIYRVYFDTSMKPQLNINNCCNNYYNNNCCNNCCNNCNNNNCNNNCKNI